MIKFIYVDEDNVERHSEIVDGEIVGVNGTQDEMIVTIKSNKCVGWPRGHVHMLAGYSRQYILHVSDSAEKAKVICLERMKKFNSSDIIICKEQRNYVRFETTNGEIHESRPIKTIRGIRAHKIYLDANVKACDLYDCVLPVIDYDKEKLCLVR